MSWTCKRKKKAYLVLFILSEENVFNICVLSQCIVNWIHFQGIPTFTYQNITWYTILLVFKIFESLQCIRLGKLIPNTPNHRQAYTESNLKSSAQSFLSKLGLTQVQKPLQGQITPVLGYLGNLGKLGPRAVIFTGLPIYIILKQSM